MGLHPLGIVAGQGRAIRTSLVYFVLTHLDPGFVTHILI